MSKMIFYFLCTLTLFISVNSGKIMTVDEFFNLQNQDLVPKEDCQDIINNFRELFKHYAFYNTAADPPQPGNPSDYFDKLNIETLFDDIYASCDSLTEYDFKNKIFEKFGLLKETHTFPYLNRFMKFTNYFFISPVNLNIKTFEDGAKPKLYASISEKYNFTLLNKTMEEEIIESNIKNSISKINGVDPFTYIQNFYGNSLKIRSPHGTYVFKRNSIKLSHLCKLLYNCSFAL